MRTLQGKPESISSVISKVKNSLESQFRNILVSGEVTNLSMSSAGHCYFTLSDKNSSLSVAMFRGDTLRNPVIKKIKNGDQVNCFGSISVYEKRGTFQLIAKSIEPQGKGDLLEQFNELKKRLAAEGLFNVDEKKEIPSFPKKVAVITAGGGAALQDFLNIYDRRSFWSSITVIPTLVQGSGSPASLRKSLFRAIDFSLKNPEEAYDVIVLTRGGGSLEDLWSFNDEGLAWDIFNCPIPVISAVGHQVDFSISDYVADKRCETPSAAAELLTTGQVGLVERISSIKRHLSSFGENLLYPYLHKIELGNPRRVLQKITEVSNRYRRSLDQLNLTGRSDELIGLVQVYQQMDEFFSVLKSSAPEKVKELSVSLESTGKVLNVLDPSNVLSRGYSMVKNSDGQLVGSADAFQKAEDDKFSLYFYDGKEEIQKAKK
jgi:exodeoxyribonuclease VII large subunit